MASDAEILIPAQFTGHIVTQFGGCPHDRLVAADPTVTPPSCTPAGAAQNLPAAANRVPAAAGGSAVRPDFSASLQRGRWFQVVGVFLLSFLLMLALPARAGRRTAEASAPGPEAGPTGEVTSASGGIINV